MIEYDALFSIIFCWFLLSSINFHSFPLFIVASSPNPLPYIIGIIVSSIHIFSITLKFVE